MKNNHAKLKTILSYCSIVSLAGILVFCTSFSVYATRINDYANSPNDLATIQRYNKAMETCIPGGLGGGFSYDTSGSGDYKLENMQKSYDRLMGKQYFFNEYSGSLIYSEEFEKNVSQGSYDGGIFGSGNSDGKMYCGENNSILLDKSLGVFGLAKDADTLKSLYCNGNNDGIYKITKKKYDDNYKVVEENSNCGENFDLFVKYATNKTTDPEYSISVSVADGAGEYYKQWFKQKVGDFSKLSSDQQKAMNYAEAVHNFQTLCSATGPSDTSFGSKSEVTAYDTTGKKVYYQIGVDADDKFYTGINSKTEQTCADMAGQMNEDAAKAFAAVVGTVNPSDPNNPNNPSTPPIDDGGNTGEEPTCYNGAGSLGWILCPILNGLGDTVEDIYDNVVTPFLQVGPELTNSSGVSDAWNSFRNIANIVFIILLLVIVFSQLTGVGIDNYGIKKILPKLIISAIMINLSFIICQLAVDISNIVGSSLNGLFNSMGNDVTINSIQYGTVSATANGNVSGVSTVLSVVLPLLVGAGAILAQGWAILLPLLMVAISAVVAVIFAFLLLSVRQAGVVVLVVVSPIAFVLYMLPNTRKIFDKWLKMFEGLLLLYPICGLLIGGGSFVSKVLLSTQGGSTNFFFALAAMLVNIAPFFFIPTVLKGSFSAMGNLGAKISGLGKSLGGRANSAIGKSAWYNDARTRAQAGVNRNGKVTGFGNFRTNLANKTGIGKRSIARARAGAIKGNAETKRNDLLMSAGYMAAAAAAQDSAMSKEQLEAEMSNMKEDTKNYDADLMSSQLSQMLSSNKAIVKGSAEELRAKALMKKLATSGGYGKKLLANQMANASMENRQFAASFMSKDSDVAGAVASKNAAAAQYLREINAHGDNAVRVTGADGRVSDTTVAELKDFESWKNALRASGKDASGNATFDDTTTNAQFVVDKVVDRDEDLIMQSDSAVEESLQNISKERLLGIYNNDILFNSATDGVKTAIRKTLQQKYNIDVNTLATNSVIDVPHGNSTTTTPQPMPYQLDATQMATARNYLRTHDLSNINSEMLQHIANGETAVLDDRVLAAQAELNRRSRTPGNSSK